MLDCLQIHSQGYSLSLVELSISRIEGVIPHGFIRSIEYGAAVQIKGAARTGTGIEQRAGSGIFIGNVPSDDG